jgi:hypothetical protein
MTEFTINSRAMRIVIVLVVIVGFGVWEFGIKAPEQRAEQYTGTISETYRSRDWLRGLRSPSEPEYRYYDYYWTIQTDDGDEITVEVPNTTWSNGEAGKAVVKVEGNRYPQLKQHAEQQQEVERYF